MVDLRRLRGAIWVRGLTCQDLSAETGIHISTLYRKLRGDGIFSIREANDIARALSLDAAEMQSIFFAEIGAETQQQEQEAKK